jgi:hypothetical protein
MSSEYDTNIFIPFCIFHYIDVSNNTYYGLIKNPTKIKTHDGNEIFKCLEDDYGIWKLYGLFYAMSPMIRPIPVGLKLMNAIKSEKFPYNTENIEYAYDPFDIQPKSVSFITWSKPVPDTVPLYLHTTPSGGMYPSFEYNPPEKEGWAKNVISPLYVLVDTIKNIQFNYKRDSYNRPIFKFTSYDGRCLPDANGTSLSNCFLSTCENISGDGRELFNPSLLKQLKHKQDYRKLHPFTVMIITILFLISLIVCILILI